MLTEPNRNSPSYAKIRFPRMGLKDVGVIVQMNTEVIGLRMSEDVPYWKDVPVGEAGELTVTVQGAFHRFQFGLVGYSENTLLLSIANALRHAEHRQVERVEVCLRSAWRALRSDGSCGAWCQGATQDLSFAGVRLLIPSVQSVPSSIEALLYLSENAAEKQGAAEGHIPQNRLAYSQTLAPAEPPVKIRGAVRHYSYLADGGASLGLSFTRVSDLDTLRLKRFLSERRLH